MCFSKINFNKFVISQKYTSSSTFKLLFGKIFLPLKLLDTNSKLNCTPVYKFILHRVPGHVNKTKWPTKDEHSLKMLPQTRQFGQFYFYLIYCYNCDKGKRPQSRTPTHQASPHYLQNLSCTQNTYLLPIKTNYVKGTQDSWSQILRTLSPKHQLVKFVEKYFTETQTSTTQWKHTAPILTIQM